MSTQTSLELLAEFETAKKSAQVLFRRAAKHMPGSVLVTRQAIREALGDPPYDVAYIKDNFSALVHDLQTRAYGLYLEAERLACAPILAEYVASQAVTPSDGATPQNFADSFFVLDRFCLSLTQSRRTRAGTAFETVVTTLFEALGYPYTFQPELSGSKPDFVLPNLAHYNAFAADCIIFTCMSSLANCSRQSFSEGPVGRQFFIATSDDAISPVDLADMRNRRIRVVVSEDLKENVYQSALNVISFEFFFAHFTEPALKRWHHNQSI